jgi:SAM-dependent methyltransferase
VVATDVSAEQIRHAAPHPRVEYRVARAETSGLDAAAVDLAAAAAAAHWFDLVAFGAEVRRVVRPGGLLAVWTYHLGIVEPPFDALFHRFYWEILKPYFAPATRLVDERYETLARWRARGARLHGHRRVDARQLATSSLAGAAAELSGA